MGRLIGERRNLGESRVCSYSKYIGKKKGEHEKMEADDRAEEGKQEQKKLEKVELYTKGREFAC